MSCVKSFFGAFYFAPKNSERNDGMDRHRKGCKVHMLVEIIDVFIAGHLREIEKLREVRDDTSLEAPVNARIYENEKFVKELKSMRSCFELLVGHDT